MCTVWNRRLGGFTTLVLVVQGMQAASAQDMEATFQKANTYIEVAKMTERAVDSWDRYASWVNMKTGPTGKERYISYGMYELYDLKGLLAEARAAAGTTPSIPKLDAAMVRYIDVYESVAPVMNRANAYYERKGYETDNAAEGQALHKEMEPLVTAFLAQRDALMPELRAFARDAEQQEVAALEKSSNRSAVWQVAQVMHAANRVVDLFPRDRPRPIDSDELDQMLNALGPDTPGEKFDQIIAGVVPPPQSSVIDVRRFGEALENYAEAVTTFEAFSGEKSEEFDEFKGMPRQMLELLRSFSGPLVKSGGHEFEGGGQMVGQIVQTYFEMSNTGNAIWGSRLSYLP